jgi:3-oxoacyl-[acyl-carrier protein] reductase
MNEDRKLTALVTGSRTGLGEFMARRLLAMGYRVFGCSRQPATWHHDAYTHVQADVGDEKAVSELFRRIRKDAETLDAVINNAGIASMNHSLLVPFATVERVMRTNFCGAFLVAREAAKSMRKSGFGRIVNVTTVAVPLRLEGEAIYAASKSAVESMTRVLAYEFAEFGITVNAVGPSPVDTNLIRGVPEEAISRLVRRLAIKRKGTPEDVMNVIEFFLRPESSYVTGQVVYLGGAG